MAKFYFLHISSFTLQNWICTAEIFKNRMHRVVFDEWGQVDSKFVREYSSRQIIANKPLTRIHIRCNISLRTALTEIHVDRTITNAARSFVHVAGSLSCHSLFPNNDDEAGLSAAWRNDNARLLFLNTCGRCNICTRRIHEKRVQETRVCRSCMWLLAGNKNDACPLCILSMRKHNN